MIMMIYIFLGKNTQTTCIVNLLKPFTGSGDQSYGPNSSFPEAPTHALFGLVNPSPHLKGHPGL